MPELNRPAFQVAGDIRLLSLAALIERGITVNLECEACYHKADWTPEFMEHALARHLATPIWIVARNLRCSECRSEYVRVWKTDAPTEPAAVVS